MNDEAERVLGRLSLADRVAQMVFPRFAGLHRVNDQFEVYRVGPWVREARLGGLILFGGNLFETPATVNAIQNEAVDVALLVSADLEWGAGQQISGATRLPPAMALGAAGDLELSRLAGYVTAIEARAFGIHLLFAPVADLNTEPDNPIINTRAFGAEPDAVAARVTAWIEGCLSGGALPTVKHFPGHGATTRDSHLTLPVLEVDQETLEKREWVPFRAAFAAGAPACMVAHLLVPALDPDRPASLSPRVIRGLLRERLGFNGLVVTDALTMGGAIEGIGADEACVRAVEAGNDVLLHPEDPLRTIEAVVEAVRGGRIPESTIENAARRVLEAKARLGLLRHAMVQVDPIDEMLAVNAELPRRIAEASLTLLRNRGDLLPAPPGPLTLLSLEEEEAHSESSAAWLRAFHRLGAQVAARRLRAGTSDAEIQALVAGLPAAGPLIVGVFSRTRGYKGDARLDPTLRRALAALVPHGARACVVAFGNPYVLRDAGNAAALVAAFSDVPAMLEACAEAVLGRRRFRGTMPVTMPLP